MTRTPRDFQPGAAYHLISRFVDREWFITTEEQRETYLHFLGRALTESDWRCLAYAVMSNHLHLAMIAGTDLLDTWIRRVHSPFADWMNRTHDRIGAMFVRGPKAIETPPARIANLIAYIHNNPVRGGVVTAAALSGWTSHRAYLGYVRTPGWLHVDEGLRRAGFDDRIMFDRWVSLGAADPERDALERERRPERIPPVRSCSAATTNAALVDPSAIVEITARELGVSLRTLRSRHRGALPMLARSAAVRCGDQLGVSGAAMARAVGLSQQRVSAILRNEAETAAVRQAADRVFIRMSGGRT
jgi:hypothetical protein